MKPILLSLSVILSTVLLSDELSWVDEQVQAIKPPRSGVHSREISHIKDPFIFLAKNRNGNDINKENKSKISRKIPSKTTASVRPKKKQVVKKVLSLGAIMNNSVMISGEWYKLGDTLNGYTIRKLTFNSVLLTKNKKQLLLSTKSRSKTIKFLK